MRLDGSKSLRPAAVSGEHDYAAQSDPILESEYASDEFTTRCNHRLLRVSEDNGGPQLRRQESNEFSAPPRYEVRRRARPGWTDILLRDPGH